VNLLKFNKFCLKIAVVALIFIPITATQAATTTITLTIAGGGLSISAPSSGTFGTVASPSSASVELGAVTVTDTRDPYEVTWTATAIITALTHSDGVTTIPATLFRYTADVPTKTGSVTLTELAETAFDSPVAVVSAASINGNNSATWTPLITIPVPASTPTGTYTGTITHSVS
jgi:hypothetical protein